LKKLTIAIPLLLVGYCIYCQPTRSPLSARYTTIGTYSKNFIDAFSGSTNQAALAEVKDAGAGVYGERRFMLKALSNFAAAIALPSRLGGFGMTMRYFGGEQFNTSQIGLGYGRKLHERIDIGIQFNYNTIKLAGYGSAGAINFEAGTLIHLTDKLHMGLHVYNPVGGKFGKQPDEQLASVYTVGMGYEASPVLFISTDIGKEENQPVNINAGMQYIFARHFFARLGIASSTGNYFFGLGLRWKTFRLDMVSSWQAPLGFTPAIMLLFDFHSPAQTTQE
jgi:hypothetical protein